MNIITLNRHTRYLKIILSHERDYLKYKLMAQVFNKRPKVFKFKSLGHHNFRDEQILD